MTAAGGALAVRGEAALVIAGRVRRLRPSFAALAAAEAELGPLFALVERAAGGGLTLAETARLIWHCLDRSDPASDLAAIDVDAVGAALTAAGLAASAPVLRALLTQIVQGLGTGAAIAAP